MRIEEVAWVANKRLNVGPFTSEGPVEAPSIWDDLDKWIDGHEWNYLIVA